MWHLATFAGGTGRLPGGHSRDWLFIKNTMHNAMQVESQIKLSRPIWDRPETRASFPGFLNTPNRFCAFRFP
jgi:hypothetical protein